jgi:hypothetical protein
VCTFCVAIIGSKSKTKQAGSSRFVAVHLDKAPYDTRPPGSYFHGSHEKHPSALSESHAIPPGGLRLADGKPLRPRVHGEVGSDMHDGFLDCRKVGSVGRQVCHDSCMLKKDFT